MKIEKVLIKDINPAVYNPRVDLQPGDVAYEQLCKSMDTFGCVQPLVFNQRTGNLVGGHQRLKVLKGKGYKAVEVVIVDLDLEKEKTLNLALNKIQGDWDEDKLKDIFLDLTVLPDFELELTGFNLEEVNLLLDQGEVIEDDGFDCQQELERIENPITQKGDILQLGEHKIMCGDSSSLDDFKRLFGGQKINLLNCDFPYNVNYIGDRPSPEIKPKKLKKWNKIHCDNMPQEEYEKWMKGVFENIKKFLLPGSSIYAWQGHRQFPPMYQILLDLDFHISCVLCWEKETFAISYADYSFQTEQCLYGWLNGASHYWAGSPKETTLWKVNRDPFKSYQHPTQKPVELAQRAIRNSSKRGNIVFDAFLGSGSTLIAAETLDRRCFGMEIDPKYCDVIVRRYIHLKGEDSISEQLKERYLNK